MNLNEALLSAREGNFVTNGYFDKTNHFIIIMANSIMRMELLFYKIFLEDRILQLMEGGAFL